MRLTRWTWIAMLLLVGASSWGATRLASQLAGQRTALPESVNVAAAVPMSSDSVAITRPDGFIGVVLPAGAVDIVSRSDGRVSLLRVRPGIRLRSGDTVATLDTRALGIEETNIANADVQLAELEAVRRSMDVDHARSRRLRAAKLHSEGLLSASELEEAALAEQSAIAALRSAEGVVDQRARVRQQRSRLSASLDLRAPFAGLITDTYVIEGATVTAGARIARLVKEGAWRLRFAVPPDQAPLLRVGDRVEARLPHDVAPLEGTVGMIALDVDSASQMVFVEASVSAVRGAGQHSTWVGRAVRVRPMVGK